MPEPGEVETGLEALSAIDRTLWGKAVANSFTVAAPKAAKSRSVYGPAGAAVLTAGIMWGVLGVCAVWLWLPLFIIGGGTWNVATACLFASIYVLMGVAMLRVWRSRKLGRVWRTLQTQAPRL